MNKGILILALAVASALAASITDIATMPPSERATNVWVVLVAGSNYYYNYRHQSDICAMYQALHNLGIPDARIIVFMYDDIASDPQNPVGEIWNEPGQKDVYAGVPKDYTGEMVTPTNFLAVLRGEVPKGEGSGKTLKSKSTDNVFIFFSDHGGAGVLGFPNDMLQSAELSSTLVTMGTKKMFKKLVFNVEACEAGSMFYDVKLPANAYITTASPIGLSSYAWMWDDDAGAYLSDVWSWYMLEYLRSAPASDTLQMQFDATSDAMSNWSQPCQYGTVSVAKTTLGAFYKPAARVPARFSAAASDAVKAYDVSLITAQRRHARKNSLETLRVLEAETRAHAAIDAFMTRLGISGAEKSANDVSQCTEALWVSGCYMPAGQALRESCGHARHEYMGRVTEAVASACRAGADARVLIKAIADECPSLKL